MDGRLFAPQQALPVDLQTPAWIAPVPNETLASYGRRMAATIDAATNDIGDEQPLWIGGVSFGGMVALEAVRHLKRTRPCGVFLIASARSCQAVPPLLRPIGKRAQIMPMSMVHASLRLVPLLVRVAGRFTRLLRPLPVEIISQAQPEIVRWGVAAVCQWELSGDPGVPVHHIHGAIDYVLPVHRVKPDEIVPGGGHLINITHAAVVNRFILEGIQEYEGTCHKDSV